MATTYLNVTFKEKDKVKALGARWDQNERKWFVPDGHDLSLFAPWLPSDHSEIIYQQSLELATDPYTEKACSLSQLLSRIAQVIPQVTPKAEWVKAEISEYRVTKNGHIHIDLAEFDTHKTLLCKASAKLFKADATVITNKFSQATGASLAQGMKVLLLVKAQFHIQYGFSLMIEDIDPTYTLGDIAAKLAHIRQTLQQEGIFQNNKKLPIPKEFCKIAVISPKAAAGLGDFKREADFLEQFKLCHFHYYEAQFQGDAAGSEILAAMNKACEDHKTYHFDAMVIIRGGGATIDLAWLNDLAIARQVCLAPLPIFSGIGHERDNTVIDEVVNQRFDTPSKVIAHILTSIIYNAKEAINNFNAIHTQCKYLISDHKQKIISHYQRIVDNTKHQLQMVYVQIDNVYQQTLSITSNHISNTVKAIDQDIQTIHYLAPKEFIVAKNQIEQLLQNINAASQTQLATLQQQIQNHIEQIYEKSHTVCFHYQKELEKSFLHILSLGPQDTLKRGFALVSDTENNVITSREQAKAKKHLTIEFHDGKLTVEPKQ